MRPPALLAALLALITVLLAGAACARNDRADYGLQSEAAAFVPARIAILPCRPWPVGARFPGQPLTSLRDADLAPHCAQIDQFVEQGFEGQPFMRGFSTRFVQRALGEAGLAGKLDEVPQLWGRIDAAACDACRSAPATYRTQIADLAPWEVWLADVSRALRGADAVLMPFLTHAYERSYVDRGVVVAERGLGVALLLVETATGDLLWAGGRETVVPNKRLVSGGVPADVPLPPWPAVTERVLDEALWRDFPGRQLK